MIEGFIGMFSGIMTANGLGGGTTLILLLSLILNVEQHTAQATNLIFYIPTAINSSIISFKNKLLNIKTCILIITSGIIGSILGATISANLKVEKLKNVFGFFLLFISIYEMYNFYVMYIKKKKSK